MPDVTIEVLDFEELTRRRENLRRELAEVEDCLRDYEIPPPWQYVPPSPRGPDQ